MNPLVVDSAVAVKWFLSEPLSAEAATILDSYRAGALVLLAPDLIYAEFGNVLWKRHVFQHLALQDARAILKAFRDLELQITPSFDLQAAAFDLAAVHRRTVYDMLYLALSLREACPCVTADEKLVHALGPSIPNVVSLSAWR